MYENCATAGRYVGQNKEAHGGIVILSLLFPLNSSEVGIGIQIDARYVPTIHLDQRVLELGQQSRRQILVQKTKR